MLDVGYHELLHRFGRTIGDRLGENPPAWLDPILHVVLIWTPLALLVVVAVRLGYWIAARSAHALQTVAERERPAIPGFERSVFRYILRHSRRQQALLIVTSLAAMPLLYATLELPKIIINNAIESGHFPVLVLGAPFGQTEYLFVLCGLYFVALLASGALKFWLNVYKGRVGERMIRRLRLWIYGRWRRGSGETRRSDVIPMISQEVEPIGGFSADAFSLPVFQGGTLATILLFMFMQDPVLGAAAITLLPIQLLVIPRLQRRVNTLARARVTEVRRLGGEIGDQVASHRASSGLRPVTQSLRRIEDIRLEIHRRKFFMKSLNNFLTSLTPFFFYSIGGYLVIDGQLTLGALVAVLAAYKDFSAPLRELFRYYQAAEDVRIRYREVLAFIGAASGDIASGPRLSGGRTRDSGGELKLAGE